ncbi:MULTISPECIES: hypothetical protein [unclassified Nocardioides]|uniref:hypothetical protein n=1 Tax=unclassified Nocardioides TaxID=2615069 RepID=UPI0036244D0A
MSEFDTTDEVEPEERPDEEEYVGEGDGPTSPETGTRYDERGETEITPHDLEEVEAGDGE